MLYALRMGLIAAIFLFACTEWSFSQSASPVPKSAKPQPGSSLFSSETSEQKANETLRASATAELRSQLLEREYAFANDQLKKLTNEVQQLDDQLTASHLSMESFPDILKMLQSSRVELVIDLAGLEARQKELLKQRETTAPTNQQPLLAKELSIAQELVKTNQEEFNLMEAKFKAGNAHSTEVLAAKKELKLAELRLALAESKSAEWSNVHSSELSKLILDRCEKSARLAVVEKLLESTYKAKPLATSLNDALDQVKALQSLARRLSSDLREAKLEMELNRYLLESSNQPSVDQK